MTQTAIAPTPTKCTCGAMNLESCLCGTTAHDWFAAEQPVKLTAVEKRSAFIKDCTTPLADVANARATMKLAGLSEDLIPELTVDDLRKIAEHMDSEGHALGRTDRWRNACQFARIEIKDAEEMGQLDESLARWAVVQGSVFMAHAAD